MNIHVTKSFILLQLSMLMQIQGIKQEKMHGPRCFTFEDSVLLSMKYVQRRMGK